MRNKPIKRAPLRVKCVLLNVARYAPRLGIEAAGGFIADQEREADNCHHFWVAITKESVVNCF